MLEIDVYRRAAWSVVSLVGDLDLAGVPAFRAAAGQLVMEREPRIVIDLTAVDLLDSSGMGVLLGFRRRVHRNGGEIRLVAPANHVSALLHKVDFHRVFALHPDLEQAVADPPEVEVPHG